MLVSDLFEDMSYDQDKKFVLGEVKEWLKAGGVTKDDLVEALAKVKKSPEFKAVIAKGLVYDPREGAEKNGSLHFKVSGTEKSAGGKEIPFETVYTVYANGQIRSKELKSSWRQGTGTTSAQGRLRSLKPTMVAGDPVASVVRTMTKALGELASKALKTVKKGIKE